MINGIWRIACPRGKIVIGHEHRTTAASALVARDRYSIV
jgi:hypothetical protein